MFSYVSRLVEARVGKAREDDRCLFVVRLSLIRFGSILFPITQSKTKAWKVVNHAKCITVPRGGDWGRQRFKYQGKRKSTEKS